METYREVACFSKVILASIVKPNVARSSDLVSGVNPVNQLYPELMHGIDWGWIVCDLETIIVSVLLAFKFIFSWLHHLLTLMNTIRGLKVKVKSSIAWSLPVENLLPQLECGVNYQLLAVITEVAQLGTPSCSRPNQLPTIASETVDPIDWSHRPHPHGQYLLGASCIV